MVTKHLTDEEIQEVALEINIAAVNAEHLHDCLQCQEKLADYRLLITAINDQPVASLDFDLAESVLAKLPVSKQAPQPLNIFFPVAAIIAGIGLLLFILRNWLAVFFDGLAMLSLSVMLISVIMVLILFCMDMFSTYKKSMNALDLY